MLAERCGKSERSIKRDIATMRDKLDAPIAVSRGKAGCGYYYTHPFRLAPEPFSEQELFALSMALQLAETSRNLPFLPAIKGALQKLREVQRVAGYASGDEMAGHITLLAEAAPPENVEDAVHFYELLKARDRCRQVRMTYYTMSRDEESTRIIDPYQLYHYDGLWYVYAHCHTRRENRDFAINRIRALTPLDTTFTPPEQETILHQLGLRYANIADEPVTVAIRFDKATAGRIRERIWHPSQQLEVNETDGSCVLTMTVTGLTTITRWVLSFGAHALPLAPECFVTRITQEVEAMARQLSEPRKAAHR